jgi:hypothetical protein
VEEFVEELEDAPVDEGIPPDEGDAGALLPPPDELERTEELSKIERKLT